MPSRNDLLSLTAELVDIPSVSHGEQAIVDLLEARLRSVPWLDVTRIANNVVARTRQGRSRRVVLGGHTDTVPPNNNERARVDGDVVWGVGSADMKSGLAVLLDLAETMAQPAVDVTYIFYECEEVAFVHSGLGKLATAAPELLAADAAVLLEPTAGLIEAGCQGTMRLRLTVRGARAHSARPWMGRNAIHRLAAVLDRLARYDERRPTIDGCQYREALQAVGVDGGVAGNVVPDQVVLTLNHRFAPDRDAAAALAHVREVIGDDVLGDDAELDVVDVAEGALPGLGNPLLASLVSQIAASPTAKLGWTDVSFFSQRGTPALNLGPGDPTLAHTAGERVHRAEIERVHQLLTTLVTDPG